MERKYLAKEEQEKLIRDKGLNKPFEELTTEQQEELADILTRDHEQELWETGQLGCDDEHVEKAGLKIRFNTQKQ